MDYDIMDIKKLVLIIFFSSIAHQEELFLQAKQAYAQKSYDKALELFERIEPKNSVIWYDIGVCLLSLNKPLEALIVFKKAQRYATSAQEFERCQQMSHWVNNQQGYDSSDWFSRDQKLIFYFKSFLLLLLNYIAAGSMTLLLFLLYKKVGNTKGMVLLLIMIGLGSLIMNNVVTTMMHRSYGIITESTPVVAVPDSHGETKGVLSAGQEVLIERAYGDWLLIKNAAFAGWINNNHCVVIV